MPSEITQSSKKVFLSSLSREEQLSTLWDVGQFIKSEQARDKKDHIEIRKELNFLKGEISGIGRRGHDTHPTMTTSQKINVAIENKSWAWIWYRDKVLAPTLSALHLIIVSAILYLAFGGKLP